MGLHGHLHSPLDVNSLNTARYTWKKSVVVHFPVQNNDYIYLCYVKDRLLWLDAQLEKDGCIFGTDSRI